MNLNKNQKEAIEHIDGPLLIIAGPGSGKTRTLVERMVYMIKKGINPENILITTFTERAAKEILTRVSERLKNLKLNLGNMYIGTIHSICLRIIDENIEKSRLKKGYQILDSLDQIFFIYSKLRFFKEIEGFEKFFVEKKFYNSWNKSKELSRWFNKLGEVEKRENIINDRIEFLEKAYSLYETLLISENKIDFTTIQKESYRLLIENEEILKKYREKITHLMIDEYQDTNSLQEKLLFLLSGEKRNICVVGDDDQGIYRFRGATIKNILQFNKIIGERCKVVKLETNYRSEEDIVKFCKMWIETLNWEDCRHIKEIDVLEEKKNGLKKVVKLGVKDSYSKWQESIANFLIFLKKTGKIVDYNQVAFLFRSVKNSRVISLVHYLEYKGIGVYTPRSNLFFEREEIKKLVGMYTYVYYKEILEEKNLIEYSDIEKYCYNSLNKLNKIIRENEKLKNSLEKLKERYFEKVSGNFLDIFYEFITIGLFNLEEKDGGILENRELYNLGIFSKIVSKSVILSKMGGLNKEILPKFIDYFFNRHLKFLKQSGIEEYEDKSEFAPKNSVSFLTIHQAKGLEFPVVVVGSLENGPDNKELDELEEFFLEKNGIEPEYRLNDFDFWRLYYTAFSRAKNLLVLTCVESKDKVPALPFKRVYDSIPDIRSSEFSFAKLNVEKIQDITLKKEYSFTEDYLRYKECPFKYNFFEKYELEENKKIGDFYGILLHQTLEEINLQKKLGNKIKNSEELIEENYNLLKIRYGLALKKEILNRAISQVELYLERGKRFLENIYDIEKTVEIVEKNHIIKGKLDLIYKENDEYIVVDFKTGINFEENIYKEQIELYCTLLKKSGIEKVKGGIIYSIKTGEEVYYPFVESKIDEILEKFNCVIDKIEQKEFEKREKDRICETCKLKNYCFNIM